MALLSTLSDLCSKEYRGEMLHTRFLCSLWMGVVLTISAVLVLGTASAVFAQTDVRSDEPLVYFYSETCPYCMQQRAFLVTLADRYPDLAIEAYDITKRESVEQLDVLLVQYPDAASYRGVVPLTFYRDRHFVGFNDEVASSLEAMVAGEQRSRADVPAMIAVPLWGDVARDDLSAPMLAAVLGIVDGFNVCSVGALILILSLVLKLRERRLVLIYGSLFITVTAGVYLLLIILWHQLFRIVAPYISFFEVLVGLIAIVGGAYFLREFIRFRRYGVTCESGSGRLVVSATDVVERAFASGKRWSIAGAIVVFAAVIVLIEFPCSAAIPLTLAGVLATMELSTFGYIGAMCIFIFFYLLDELIIFAVAVYSMRLWANSTRFVKYSTLVGALVLFAFGVFYLWSAW